MNSRKFRKILSIFCFVFILGFGSWILATDEETGMFEQTFLHNGIQYRLSVEQAGDGFDLYLDNGIIQRNLSLEFPGENLFPKVQIHNDYFYITWIYSKDRRAYACYYESSTDAAKKISGEGFRFLTTPEIVFQGGQPQALVFLGNLGETNVTENITVDNDDIFVYHLNSQRLVNITRTPENEKVFSLISISRGFILKAETLSYDADYTVRFPGLRVTHVEKRSKEINEVSPPLEVTSTAYNTLVAFGDSITWGKIRMVGLEGEHHPELAYLGLIQNELTENYRSVNTINLGIPGDTTYNGIQRLRDEFNGIEGYFCMIMFGTNDVGQNSFSPTSSVENLQWICTQIRDDYGMYPIISTIPPMLHISGEQYLKENSEELNEKILLMAQENNIPVVDTYAAFFAAPDWEVLIEDILGNHVVGNHPSPAGHQVIAGLFLTEVLKLPPQMPGDFQVHSTDPYRLLAQWSTNYEFDFDHYVIEFGFSENNLNRHIETANNFYTFTRPPFQFFSQSSIYFRVKAVDKDDYSSNYTNIIKMEFQ